MHQAGGKALVMEAEATSQLQKLGVLPTDDKPKYTWHKVIISDLASDLWPHQADGFCFTSEPGILFEQA